MIELTLEENLIASKIKKIKYESGSHSPSLFTISEQIPELTIKVDACFLSNPYATELFIKYLKEDLIETNKLRDVLEFYPSQNNIIAGFVSDVINVDKKNIFVGNGAVEIIQAVMQRFVKRKAVINIPTFSSYYEFANDDTEVVYYQLEKENNYEICVEKYLSFIKDHNPDSIIIINPNNPNGGYIPYKDLFHIVNELKEINNIIIDESFIHFAYENMDYSLISATDLFKNFKNVIVIKSMSKDFGIAGVRSGYAVMDEAKVLELLKNGYLWNSSGLSEYFFNLYRRRDFHEKYELVRKKYIKNTSDFIHKLGNISNIKVYPSKANFALIELIDGSTSADFVSKMLIKYGIYTRTGSDKIGLTGEFIRIAARTEEENQIILDALNDLF